MPIRRVGATLRTRSVAARIVVGIISGRQAKVWVIRASRAGHDSAHTNRGIAARPGARTAPRLQLPQLRRSVPARAHQGTEGEREIGRRTTARSRVVRRDMKSAVAAEHSTRARAQRPAARASLFPLGGSWSGSPCGRTAAPRARAPFSDWRDHDSEAVAEGAPSVSRGRRVVVEMLFGRAQRPCRPSCPYPLRALVVDDRVRGVPHSSGRAHLVDAGAIRFLRRIEKHLQLSVAFYAPRLRPSLFRKPNADTTDPWATHAPTEDS